MKYKNHYSREVGKSPCHTCGHRDVKYNEEPCNCCVCNEKTEEDTNDVILKLTTLLSYYGGTHRQGHTQAVLRGAKNSNCLVLVSNSQESKDIRLDNRKTISLEFLDGLKGQNKPLLIDNSAIIQILRDALRVINQQKEEKSNLEIDDTNCDERWRDINLMIKHLKDIREKYGSLPFKGDYRIVTEIDDNIGVIVRRHVELIEE